MPTVPRSALRSVGRLNFLDPFTETTEEGRKRQLLSTRNQRGVRGNGLLCRISTKIPMNNYLGACI